MTLAVMNIIMLGLTVFMSVLTCIMFVILSLGKATSPGALLGGILIRVLLLFEAAAGVMALNVIVTKVWQAYFDNLDVVVTQFAVFAFLAGLVTFVLSIMFTFFVLSKNLEGIKEAILLRLGLVMLQLITIVLSYLSGMSILGNIA